MTKEDLEKYKKFLSLLSTEDKKKRNEYVWNLQTGVIQGQPVGYSSIDKPYVKHFPIESVNFDFKEETMYDYMYTRAHDYKYRVAFPYFNKQITYEEYFNHIDENIKAFKNIGIKEGDKVTALLPTIPEASYIIYALNKIGAIINPISPLTKQSQVTSCLNEIKPKMIVTLDLCSELVNKSLNESEADVSKVISVSALESLPSSVKLFKSITDKIKGEKVNDTPSEKFIKWKDFIEAGKNYQGPLSCNIDNPGEKVAAIIYTGGTTGEKKGAKITNNDINSIVREHELSGISFHIGQKFLQFLPPFITYGLMSLHMSTSFGFQTVMIPNFTTEDFPKLVKKTKPEYVFASPVHYDELCKSKKSDLSFITLAVSGGGSMGLTEEKRARDIIGKDKFGQGIGMTEATGTIAVPIPGKIKMGSVGVPFANTDLAIFRPYTDDEGNLECIDDEELPYDTIGEICFRGPSIMQGYFNRPEQTEKVLKVHKSDGYIWLHTRDLGKMDQDGYLFFVDRLKRVFNRGKTGLKVYPSAIETVVASHPAVLKCVAVAADGSEEGTVPIVHVSLKEHVDHKQVFNEIIDLCQNVLEEEAIPFGFKLRDSFPETPNGKTDYKALEKEGLDNAFLTNELCDPSHIKDKKVRAR